MRILFYISTLCLTSEIVLAGGGDGRPFIDHHAWIRGSLRQPGLSDAECERIRAMLFQEDETESVEEEVIEEVENAELDEEELQRQHQFGALMDQHPELAGYGVAIYRYLVDHRSWFLPFLLGVGLVTFELLPNELRITVEVMKMCMGVNISLGDLTL